MKKLFLLSIFFSFVCVTYAQTEFSVPTPTMEEKYNMTKMLMNNNILGLITAAKNEGMSAEELGKKSAAAFIPYWKENGDFKQFVNFALNAWACSADGVQIIEQSKKKLVVMVSSMYQSLEDQGVLFGSSVDDYTAFFNAMMSEIASHFDKSYKMTWEEDGYKIVITL